MSDVLKFESINAHGTTFKKGSSITYSATSKNGSADVGKAVKMGSVAGTVELLTEDAEPLGRLEQVHPDGFVTVNDQGYMILPCTGSITYGGGLVGSATTGKVKTGTNPVCKAIDAGASGEVVAFFR